MISMLRTYLPAFTLLGTYISAIFLGVYFLVDPEKLGTYVKGCGITLLTICVGIAIYIIKTLLS